MPGYNTQFELSLEDMDVIEAALRESKTRLSVEAVQAAGGEQDKVSRMKRIQNTLARLHNQKRFYRPQTGAYISG